MAFFAKRSLGWWYWLATAVLMVLALPLGQPWALNAAAALTVAQAIHFTIRRGSPAAFPVQVRLAYLLLLALGALAPALAVIHWAQLAGNWAMVLVGYCPLARAMALMPWNRAAPLSRELILRTFLTPPVPVATGLTAAPRP